MMEIVNFSNLEAGHVVEITTAPSSPPKKLTVPILGLEKFPSQQEIDGVNWGRRPVRPIDRQRMRPWLMELLDLGNVFGLQWTDRSMGIFQISWRHASRLGWNLETDGDVFERWARHTGIYKEGDPPEPKRWKANFRCALHSLHDVLELTNAEDRRGRNACRTYQFLQSNVANPKKSREKRQQKVVEPKRARELVRVLRVEGNMGVGQQILQIKQPRESSSDDGASDTESERSLLRDKVIVQRVDAKTGEVSEEFLLHDHDYSGQTEKSQRTIYLRQGVGSIVLHKEVLNAPQVLEDAKAVEALTNLEQLASAAVDSHQEDGQNTIVIDANTLAGSYNKLSPTKSSGVSSDEASSNEISLKTLLPRLRARIKESERGIGIIRKRKVLETEELDERNLPHPYRIKKVRSETEVNASPPSPPLTRGRSSSPKKTSGKATVSVKSKRARKESEGSASDSTEPLMSSCLLLLEAATRLDKAEKKEGDSPVGKPVVVKQGRRGRNRSGEPSASRKKRTVHKPTIRVEYTDEGVVLREQEEADIIEEPVLEDVGENVIDAFMENVIEEPAVSHSGNDEQIVYETIVSEDGTQVIKKELSSEDEESALKDILKTALENIGSELEVQTSSPKELAIMRRKKDHEKSSLYNALTRGIVVGESSIAKGLFSGSEIHPSASQIVTKRGRPKSRNSTSKDNIYFLDVCPNGETISIKPSETKSSDDGTTMIDFSGVERTVIKRELPVLSSASRSGTQSSLSSSSGQITLADISGAGRKALQEAQSASMEDVYYLKVTADGETIAIKQSDLKKEPSDNDIASVDFNEVVQTVTQDPSPSPGTSTSAPQIFISAGHGPSGQQFIVTTTNQTTELSPSTDQLTDSPSKQTVNLSNLGNAYITIGPQGKKLILKSNATPKGSATTQSSLSTAGTSQSPSNVKISTLPIISTLKSIPGQLSGVQKKPISTTADSSQLVFPTGLVTNKAEEAKQRAGGGTTRVAIVPNSAAVSFKKSSGKKIIVHTPSTAKTQEHADSGLIKLEESESTTTSHVTTDSESITPERSQSGATTSGIQSSSVDSEQVTYLINPDDLQFLHQNSGDLTSESSGQVPGNATTAGSSEDVEPVQDQDSSLSTTEASSPEAVRVEVQSTETGDQTCLISPEQLEQAHHTVHISSEADEGHLESSTKTDEEDSGETVTEDSSEIDPRAPLSIQEIPLFASSKESGSSENEEHSA